MSKVKGAVAEGGQRQKTELVKGNNIFFTVAFAESYRKTDQAVFFVYLFSDFLVAEQSAIFYC